MIYKDTYWESIGSWKEKQTTTLSVFLNVYFMTEVATGWVVGTIFNKIYLDYSVYHHDKLTQIEIIVAYIKTIKHFVIQWARI